MVKSAHEKGYDWEDATRKILVELQEVHRAAFHRFYDTKSTQGGILPPQPADFMLVRKGVPVFIECKHSEEETTLSRKYITNSVKEAQAARMRVMIRAGAIGVYLFKSDVSNVVEIWDGSHVIEVKNTNRMPPNPEFRLYRLPVEMKQIKEALLRLTES